MTDCIAHKPESETIVPEILQSMAGKTSLVTGSTDGIGLASAKKLLARGSKVMFTGVFFPLHPKDEKEQSQQDAHREKFLKEYTALQEQYGKDAMDFFEGDLTQADGADGAMSNVATLVDRAQKLGNGHIDNLVHSAGVQRRKPLFAPNGQKPGDRLSMDDMNYVYDINAKAGFATILAALPYMDTNSRDAHVSRRPGQITFLSSVHGLVGCPDSGPYCASKFALEGFMAANKHELALHGIRINAVNPAFIETALAMGPLHEAATAILEQQGITATQDKAAFNAAFPQVFEEVKKERLHLQINPETGQGDWIPMELITDAVANLADFSNGIATGANVRPDFGYVDRAMNKAGAAIMRLKPDTPDYIGGAARFNATNEANGYKKVDSLTGGYEGSATRRMQSASIMVARLSIYSSPKRLLLL